MHHRFHANGFPIARRAVEDQSSFPRHLEPLVARLGGEEFVDFSDNG